MNVSAVPDRLSVWREISSWPAHDRLVLATRILHSLELEAEFAEVSQERRDALHRLIGIWKTDAPPSDDDVERIVEEERLTKYG